MASVRPASGLSQDASGTLFTKDSIAPRIADRNLSIPYAQ
jgi:hypothetical protein